MKNNKKNIETINKMCRNCCNDCKLDADVNVVYCPEFEAIEPAPDEQIKKDIQDDQRKN